LEEGVDAFYSKPLDFEKLREKIEELTAARQSGSPADGK